MYIVQVGCLLCPSSPVLPSSLVRLFSLFACRSEVVQEAGTAAQAEPSTGEERPVEVQELHSPFWLGVACWFSFL